MIGSTPVRFRRVSSQLRKYRQIYNEDSMQGLIWSFKDLLRKTRKAFFSVEKFYLYTMNLNPETKIPNLQSKVDGLRVKPVYLPISLQEYEYMGNEGVDFEKLPEAIEYEIGLKDGTIVFLTYKDNVLMNRTGMTLYRNGVYKYCCPVDHDCVGSVYAGFSETNKAARMLGIYSFIHSYMFNYLKDMGFKRVVLLESDEQTGPRKIQDRLGAKVEYSTYCIRLFFFVYWTKPKINNPGI